MSKLITKKRIDEIEIHLTPKEWGLRLADEIRKYPSLEDAMRAGLKLPDEENILSQKPFRALAEQVEKRHPGRLREDIAAFNQLNHDLWTEFTTLRNIIFQIQLSLAKDLEVFGLKTALKLSVLHTLVLQDAFGRTPGTDSLPLGPDLRLRFSSPIEDWVQDIIGLITDVFSRQVAVQIIQDKYFNGHNILCRFTEAELGKTLKMIEDGVITFNEYLKTREALFKVEWHQEDQEDGITSFIPGEREGQLSIDLEAIKNKAKGCQGQTLADDWVKESKKKTALDRFLAKGETDQYNALLKAGLKELLKVET